MKDKPVQRNPKTKRRARRQGKRPTIGLLIANIYRPWELAQWWGVSGAAQERDVNLLCFAGRELCSPAGFDAQANVLYDLVNAGQLDGLVLWAAGFDSYVSQEELVEFCARYRPLPIVSVEKAVAGIPSVLMDNYQAMREVLVHMVEVHDYRRIAFIKHLIAGQAGFEERYRAYTETLTEHGIPFDPDLISPPFDASHPAAVAELTHWLQDERVTGADAMVGFSDEVVLYAMQLLQSQGIQVPGDLAMAGFDDTAESQVISPPLTTAHPPFYQMGHEAVRALLALIEGQAVPERVVVPSQLMVRQSCGCPDPAVVQAAAGPVRAGVKTFEAAYSARRKDMLSDVARAGVDAGLAGQFLDAFAAELKGVAPGAFLPTLDDVLGQVVEKGDDVAAWQGAVSALRRHALPYLSDPETLPRAEDLWQQARVMIEERALRAQAYQHRQADLQAQTLREISQTLVTTLDVKGLGDVLAQELPRLGFPSGYLSLYENPRPYEYPQPAPEWSRLVLAYDEKGRVGLEAGGPRFLSHQLLPEGMLSREGRHHMVVESLCFRENQLGFVLFEAGPRNGTVYDALREQISSALQVALLTQQMQHRALQLQTAAEVSRAASSILDPEALIQQVVNLACERFSLYYAGLFLVDQTGEWTGEPGKWAVLRAGSGEAGRKMLEQGHKLEIGGASMIGWCIANKQARIALDVGEEAVHFENPLLPQTRSELALPLASRGEAIGALTIQSAQEMAFSQEDVAALQTMADQLANAIANARLFDREQHATSLLSRHIKELGCLNDIGRRINESPAVPGLLEWVAERIPPAMQYPDVCVAAIEFEGQVYGVPEAANLPRQMVGGVHVGGKMVGRVIIAYTEEHGFLDEESVLLGDIVRRVGGYVESRRLFEQTQAALEEVEATHRRYLRQAWAEYLQTAKKTSYETERPGVAPLGDAVLPEIQQAVERRGAVVLAGDGAAEAGHRALVTPIVLRGEIIGALGIHGDDKTRQWTADEIALVESVVERMAVAAENLRLLDETQRRAARERLIGEITDKMRRAADMDDLMQVTAQGLAAALGVSGSFVQVSRPLEPTEDQGDDRTPSPVEPE